MAGLMKKISSLTFVLIMLMLSTQAMASFIKPLAIMTPVKPVIVAQVKPQYDLFNQYLQEHILETLVLQLFDDNSRVVMANAFTGDWLFSTLTFSVEVTTDPDNYLLDLKDHLSGEEDYHLDIPIFSPFVGAVVAR